MPPIVTIEPGHAKPLGARPDANGVNFCLFSQHAIGVTLNDLVSYEANERGLPDIAWQGCSLNSPASTIRTRASSPSPWAASRETTTST